MIGIRAPDRFADWSQLYGRALTGPYQGETLVMRPALLTEWRLWRAAYPQTLVLSKEELRRRFQRGGYAEAPRSSYDVDPYASYYVMPDEGVVDHNIPRDEASLQPKQRLYGVRHGEETRAYFFADLAAHAPINDQLGDLPLVVWFDPAGESARAFDRRAAGRTLTFAPGPAPHQLRDRETGTLWHAVTGAAKSGPLAGRRLTPMVGTTAFEFGWFGYFPESGRYVR